jgi:hypothetical protein
VTHGGLILPNSVLMKSGPARFETFGAGISAVLADWLAIRSLFVRPSELVLTLAALIGLMLVPVGRLARPPREVWLALLFLGTMALHACLVKLQWFFRYESYLVALGLLALAGLSRVVDWPRGVARKRRAPLHPAVLPLLVLLALPLVVRTFSALGTTGGAVKNVYDQQIQMGRFFAKYYADTPIAVNDIGAVAWMTHGPVLDVVGLASQPVADLKRRGALDAAALDRLVAENNVAAIALYEQVFASILPAPWIKVGQWTIPDNVGVSADTVAFFAPDARSAARLRTALNDFASDLPAGVTWSPDEARLPSWVSE